jgi:hypothetical protein
LNVAKRLARQSSFGGQITSRAARDGAVERKTTTRALKERAMPGGRGSKTHFRSGTHGKGDGTGAMSEVPKDKIRENMVLSNRDKAQHSDTRGLDGKAVQTEQYQDHAGNRLNDEEA